MTDPTSSSASGRGSGVPVPTMKPETAGWYAEQATGLLRYFDGTAWTTQRRSNTTGAEAGSAPDLAIPFEALPTAAARTPPADPEARATTRPPVRRPRRSAPLLVLTFVVWAAVFALGVLTYIRLHDPGFRAQCVASRVGLTTQSFPDNLICSLLG
jgi:hypothetical protein